MFDVSGFGIYAIRNGAPVALASGGGSIWRLAMGNIDADGRPDVVFADSGSGGLRVLYQDPTQPTRLRTGPLLATGASSSWGQPAIVDLNGDGLPDIACTLYTDDGLAVFLQVPGGGGDPVFAAPVRFRIEGGPYSLGIGDVNHDGALDLVTGDQRGATIGVLLGR